MVLAMSGVLEVHGRHHERDARTRRRAAKRTSLRRGGDVGLPAEESTLMGEGKVRPRAPREGLAKAVVAGTAQRCICRPGRRSSAAQACPWASARVAHLCVTYGRSLASSIALGITRARVYGVRPKVAKPAVPPCGGASTSLRTLFQPDAPHDRASRWCDAFLVSRRKFDDSRMSAGRRNASTESASRGAPVGAGGKLAVVGGEDHVGERAKAPESPRVATSACERLIWSMPVQCG